MTDLPENEELHIAASAGSLEEVRRLIKLGCNVNALDQDLHLTPLHYAVKGGNLDVASLLIDSGADVNANYEPEIGETPLGEIASNCTYDVAKLLVDAGANPTIKGWMQLSAIDRAGKRKKDEGIRVYNLLLSTARKRFHYNGKNAG